MKPQQHTKTLLQRLREESSLTLRALVYALAALLLTTQTVQAAETVTYYHYDALGSPVAATDASGNLVWREDYKPYGERIRHEGDATNTLWYTGKPEEAALGLQYFGARWYDPQLGRFTGIDPKGFSAGNVQSFNRYAYANNNPYLFIDPDGRDPGPIYYPGVVPRTNFVTGNAFIDHGPLMMVNGIINTANSIPNIIVDAAGTVGNVGNRYAGEIESVSSGLGPIGFEAGLGIVAVSRELSSIGRMNGSAAGLENASTLKPGPYARESIPGHMGRPTASEQRQVNALMDQNGCHTCGTKTPGTKSGNSVVDHQPPQALGETTEFYPHCIDCMRRQGGEVLQEKIKRNQ